MENKKKSASQKRNYGLIVGARFDLDSIDEMDKIWKAQKLDARSEVLKFLLNDYLTRQREQINVNKAILNEKRDFVRELSKSRSDVAGSIGANEAKKLEKKTDLIIELLKDLNEKL